MNRAHSWKQSGNVSLWYYTENQRDYPGWQLTADAAGCESLMVLLDAMAADGIAASRTIELKPPSRARLAVPNNKSGLAAWRAPGKLRMVFSSNPSEWSFPPGLDPAVLAVGSDWLAPLREGISGIALGRGDHSIGPADRSGSRLWFWW
ncbi:hypothetical protein OK348_01445 [Flavobacterium sp. MXW15]|uniref:Uncharacterized protein n=1 Tax=Xanthomonas chitinilytica TaxID=2989819 RepID=A0ABT3JUK2_9XANT|nr:hypothetical protein [Xanthomonas sp. H13-6]MCW4453469.1 hypothetical protein [Flavobacterium sp. MXW15]MCW4472178.1 hypothetical protein [Xanthomonas sp. H13-6]